MKVIRKEREQYEAFKWEGASLREYEKLRTEIESKGYGSLYLNRTTKDIRLLFESGYLPIEPNKYIVFDVIPKVLSEKEFKEQYEVTE